MGRADAIKWNSDLESGVLAEIESGTPLRATGQKFNILPASIIRHVRTNKEFGERYARAKSSFAEQYADEILAISDSADPETYNVARLQVDTRKWLLSKLLPKVYGEKIQQEHSGELGIKVIAIQAGTEMPKDRPALKPAFDEKLIEGEH